MHAAATVAVHAAGQRQWEPHDRCARCHGDLGVRMFALTGDVATRVRMHALFLFATRTLYFFV